ncbi:hypothetical protein Tco_0757636 [Tanacetum coccineum]
MYTSKDDYLINSLRFVSAKESSQIYRAVLPECLTSPEMKESKAYKTYLGHATGAVPPKIARIFKKASPSKKDSIPVQEDEEPAQKGKRVKRSAKKSSTTPAAGIVFRETPVKTKSTRKEKLKEVRKKSLRDFHKTHPSGSGIVAEKPPSVEKITPTITSEGTSDKPGVPDVTEDDSTESESESWGNDKDNSNNEQEASDEGSGHENESEEQESDSEQDEESDDDNQEEEEVDQENESEDDEIESDEKTEVPVTSSSRSSDLASKFLNFSDIPQTDAEIVSQLDVHVYHESFLGQESKEQGKKSPALILTTRPRVKEEKAKQRCRTNHWAEKEDSTSGSSKDTKSQLKSSGKFVRLEEPVFEVADSDSDLPQDQEGNLGDNTTQEGLTQNWLMTLAASTSTDKSLKDFDELMSSPIDFFGCILNGLKFENLTQEILLGLAFRLFKGTRSNYAELEYDFEECYKALSKNLIGKILKAYLQGGILTMAYTTSTTKTKAAKYDLPGIEDMVPKIWMMQQIKRRCIFYKTYSGNHSCQGYEETWIQNRLTNLSRDDVADFAIALRMFTRSLVIQKRVEDLQLGVESYQKKINITKPDTTRPDLRKRHPYTPYKDPQGFIYVDDYKRNRLMRSDKLYKFSDGTLTRLLSSLEDITKNIDMEYLLKRRWSNLEKKRAHFMIKDINKLLKERRMMRSLEKFVGGRLYGTDLRLLQRTI